MKDVPTREELDQQIAYYERIVDTSTSNDRLDRAARRLVKLRQLRLTIAPARDGGER